MAQDFKNHARFVPLYHFVLALMILVFLGHSIWRLIADPGGDGAMRVLLGLILVLLYYYLRAFPLSVQDRLIRLEMRLRLREVLPPELRGRILEISPSHLIGLRFASDEELPGLVGKVLDGSLTGRQEIKKAIRSWQADEYRC